MERLRVNGREVELSRPTPLPDYLRGIGVDPRAVAVEHNGEILQRELYAACVLDDGDVVEIVRMVGGGVDPATTRRQVSPLVDPTASEEWLQALAAPRRGPAAVAWELRERVRRNQLPNGQRLRLVEIMAEWALSPADARSAMALLGRLGVVRQEPGGGAVVYRPTRAQIEESWLARRALEGLAAEEAARRIDRRGLDRLETALKEMRGTRPRNLLRFLLVVDPAFHDLVNAAAGMQRLRALVTEARVAAQIGMILVTRERLDAVEGILELHAAIVEGLAAHDPEGAAAAVRAHYDVTREYWLDAWDQGTRDEVKVETARST